MKSGRTGPEPHWPERCCALCAKYEMDDYTTLMRVNGRVQQVYMHRCRLHRERTNGTAVYDAEGCFEPRAAAEAREREERNRELGYDRPLESTTGAVQTALL